MKTITLSQGQVALVDDDNYEYLSNWKWSYFKSKDGCQRAVRNENGTTIYMHRQIMSEQKGEIDHKNLDGLDNRRQNLRPCTRSQNAANRRRQSNNTSGFKGVSWKKDKKKWRAYIKVGDRARHLGYFEDSLSAAKAYNTAALNLFGEFARLNGWPLS